MPELRKWDGSSYDRISAPMEELGRDTLARLPLRGDELVLDAGCGSGRITEALIERLPRGRVIAMDASASMVEAASKRLERFTGAEASGARVEVVLGDLLELELGEPLDAVLSTATFHWIPDHDALFARLRAALRAGGRLIAQCGGEGNINVLRGRAHAILEREPYAEHFDGWQPPWRYAGPSETREGRRTRLSAVHAQASAAEAPSAPGRSSRAAPRTSAA